MCMTGPAAVDKPVNIGGRIKFAFADQGFGLSTETAAGRSVIGGTRIGQAAQGAGRAVDQTEPTAQLFGQAQNDPQAQAAALAGVEGGRRAGAVVAHLQPAFAVHLVETDVNPAGAAGEGQSDLIFNI